jgi:hypothetical protein
MNKNNEQKNQESKGKTRLRKQECEIRVRVRNWSCLHNRSPVPENTRAAQRQEQDPIKRDGERRQKRDGELDSHVHREDSVKGREKGVGDSGRESCSLAGAAARVMSPDRRTMGGPAKMDR